MKNNFYYDSFVKCVGIAKQCANELKEILNSAGVDITEEQLKEIHLIEKQGDLCRGEVLSRLVKDFITPIERDDILKIANGIDDITDSIEDTAIEMYINHEKNVREDILPIVELIIAICTELEKLMIEFPNFRKSKTLQSLVHEIHRLEEDGDAMYIKSMRKLCGESLKASTLIAWRNIYGYLEHCCDLCADVADTIEGAVIGNT